MRRAAVLFAAVVACRGTPSPEGEPAQPSPAAPAPPQPLHAAPPPAAAAAAPPAPAAVALPPPTSIAGSDDLGARAGRALRDDAPLDYERPFKQKPDRREATVALWRQACRRGTRPACWIAYELSDDAADLAPIAANCTAGDALSCHALPKDVARPRFPEVPGAASRSAACNADPPAKCDFAAIHRECDNGFPRACSLVSLDTTTRVGNPGALSALVANLEQVDCRSGIIGACTTAGDPPPDAALEIAQLRCDIWRRDCGALEGALAQGQLAARDARERACEYGGVAADQCVILANRYLDHVYPEPVPGRGQALLDWGCPKLAGLSADAMHRVFRRCPTTGP